MTRDGLEWKATEFSDDMEWTVLFHATEESGVNAGGKAN